jgi:hypothetical protein
MISGVRKGLEIKLRIRGTKNHLIYHRRRLKNKYRTNKCGYANIKRGINCDTDCYNRRDKIKVKGSKKFQQKEFHFDLLLWFLDKNE